MEDRREHDRELHEMVKKLYGVLYENGFSSNMHLQAQSLKAVEEDLKENVKELKEFKCRFYEFIDKRAETCPTRKWIDEGGEAKRKAILLYLTALSAFAAGLSTTILLFKTIVFGS